MRALDPVIENIPPVLLSGLCTWRYEERDGKTQKPPFDPRTGRKLQQNLPHTWLSREQLQSVSPERMRAYSGIGRLSQWAVDQILMVDIDDCFCGDNLKPWARVYLESCHSYAERSPSGNGAHLFVKGSIPKWLEFSFEGNRTSYKKVRSKGSIEGSPKGEIQISLARNYSTLTGARISDATDVLVDQNFIDMLIAPLAPGGAAAQKRSSVVVPEISIPVNTTTPKPCESLLSVTVVANDKGSPTQQEIAGAVEYLSRPEVCKFFAAGWAAQGTRNDKSPSGYCATIIQSAARAGFGEEVACGIWKLWCSRYSVEFNRRKWKTSWSKLSCKHTTHNPPCESLLSVTCGPFLPMPVPPAAEFSIQFPASYTLLQRIQSIYYRGMVAELSDGEILWLAAKEVELSGVDRLITQCDVNHWGSKAQQLIQAHRLSYRLRNRGASEKVTKVAELMKMGRTAQEIAAETGATYVTIRKQMSRVRQYGLLQGEEEAGGEFDTQWPEEGWDRQRTENREKERQLALKKLSKGGNKVLRRLYERDCKTHFSASLLDKQYPNCQDCPDILRYQLLGSFELWKTWLDGLLVEDALDLKISLLAEYECFIEWRTNSRKWYYGLTPQERAQYERQKQRDEAKQLRFSRPDYRKRQYCQNCQQESKVA